ncbi:hypothetical protein SCHPADRAFT_686459 [Schizopora paradoxa]|uniref:Uncharacterized protein n=1 Tax=Schizopora paradoxa TaxID=27342 RepID=A0A0H2RAP5_9AGAM|nr:hypothetical protein SCHPADRAFT_686459 [Schizopora paradoxa]
MSKAVIGSGSSRRDTPSRGSVLTRLKPISNFIDAGAKRDVESVVKKIEQIRRHGETTIFERHADTSISLSDAELAKLKSLCKKLVDLSSSERATERYASEEIIRLSVEDPRIHLFLKELQLFPSGSYDLSMHTCCSFARFTIDDASVEVHGLWSDLFQISRGTVEGSAQTNDTMAEYLEHKNFYFIDYLQNRESSFLSARYLRHALKLGVVGNALYFIVNFWHRYLKIAINDAERSGDESIVEWSNLDGCFQSLPSGALRTAYAPPPLLADFLAQTIVYRRSNKVPSALQIFFCVPHMDPISLDKGLFSRISIDKTHFRLLPVYHAALFRALAEFPHESPLLPSEQNGRIHDAVKGMILFGDQIWTDYCEAAKQIWDYHYRNLSSESYTLPLSYYFHKITCLARNIPRCESPQ